MNREIGIEIDERETASVFPNHACVTRSFRLPSRVPCS